MIARSAFANSIINNTFVIHVGYLGFVFYSNKQKSIIKKTYLLKK